MAYAIDTSDRRRRRALRAATPLAALLVAALLIWQGSNAAFSASTYNTGDTWETGNLMLTNNGGNGSNYLGTTTALFNEQNLKPGDTGVKCITVESTGSLDGDLRLYRGTISGTNNFSALAGWIDLTVDAQTAPATTHVSADCVGYTGGAGGAVFSGTLTGMPDTYAGATGTLVAGGAQHIVYRIGWTIDTAADNTVQSSSAITDLTWEIQ
jgi:hypothetical protein